MPETEHYIEIDDPPPASAMTSISLEDRAGAASPPSEAQHRGALFGGLGGLALLGVAFFGLTWAFRKFK